MTDTILLSAHSEIESKIHKFEKISKTDVRLVIWFWFAVFI